MSNDRVLSVLRRSRNKHLAAKPPISSVPALHFASEPPMGMGSVLALHFDTAADFVNRTFFKNDGRLNTALSTGFEHGRPCPSDRTKRQDLQFGARKPIVRRIDRTRRFFEVYLIDPDHATCRIENNRDAVFVSPEVLVYTHTVRSSASTT